MTDPRYRHCPLMRMQGDPIVEYEDEFGRVRTGRKSEIPRHLLQQNEEGPPEGEEE